MQIYIDEAGRWPLAWPLYVGLVLPINIKKDSNLLSEFKDSKVLCEKKREELYNKILVLSEKWKILFSSWYVSNIIIDKLWVTKSINYSIRRGITILSWDEKSNCSKKTKKALLNISKKYWKVSLFIDGKYDFMLASDLEVEVETLIKADQKNVFVSMASIIAKVERDLVMKKMAKKYPQYWFDRHKWYGTEFHRAQILKYWACKIHRKLFLRKLFWL